MYVYHCRGGSSALSWQSSKTIMRSPLPLPFSSSPPLPLPALRLTVGPLNPAKGLWELCELHQRDLGRIPSRNRIWCILALESDSWWQQF